MSDEFDEYRNHPDNSNFSNEDILEIIKNYLGRKAYTRCIAFCNLGKDQEKDQVLLLAISHCYQFLQNSVKSMKYLNILLKIGPKDFLATYQKIANIIDPDDHQVLVTKEFCLMVIKCYQMLLIENPNCIETKLKLASFYHTIGNHTEAIKEYESIVDRDPTAISALYNLTCLYLFQKDSKKLARTYLKIANLLNEEINLLANSPDMKDKVQKCIKYYYEAQKLLPKDINIMIALAGLHRMIDKHKEAMGFIDIALKLDSNDYRVYYEGALIYDEIGDSHRAKEMIKNCLLLNMKFVKAYNFFGNMLRKEKLYDSAVKIFESGLFREPENILILNNLGNCYLEKGDKTKAKEVYLQAYHLKNETFEVNCNLATIYRKEGNLETAIYHAAKAKKLEPNNPQIYNITASIYKDAEMFDFAINAALKAIELDPNDATALFVLAQCYKLSKQYSTAINVLIKLLHIKPKNTDAFLLYIECLAYLNDWEKIKVNKHNINKIIDYSYSTQNITISFSNIFSDFLIDGVDKQMWLNAIQCEKEFSNSLYSFDFNNIPVSPYMKTSFKRIGYLVLDIPTMGIYRMLCDLVKYERKECKILVFHSKHDQDESSSPENSLDSHAEESRLLAYKWKDNPSFIDLSKKSTPKEKADIIHQHDIDCLIFLEYLHEFNYDDIKFKKAYQMLTFRPCLLQMIVPYNGMTRGGKICDYVIIDKYIYNSSFRDFYKEKLIILNQCAFLFRDLDYQISDMSKEDCIIFTEIESNHKVKYANFSTNVKISNEVFSCWMKILSNVENSVLLLKNNGEEQCACLRSYASHHCIDPSRLIFLNIPTPAEAAYTSKIDLYLDINTVNNDIYLYYCANESIPVISITSEDHPITSRLSTSILSTYIGKKNLIFNNCDNYTTYATDFGIKFHEKHEESVSTQFDTDCITNFGKSRKETSGSEKLNWRTIISFVEQMDIAFGEISNNPKELKDIVI